MRPRAGSWRVLPSPKLQLARVAQRENVAAPKETNPRRRSDGRRETNARRKRRSNANPAPYPNADVASQLDGVASERAYPPIVRSFGSSAVMDTYPEGPEDLLLERLMVMEKSVSRARWIFCARRRFRPRRSKAPSRARHHQENVAGRSRRTRTPEATSKRRRGRARAPIVRETPSLVFTIASSF